MVFVPSAPEQSGQQASPDRLEHEFASLLTAVQPLNHGRIVALHGAPGLGKSTLVNRLMERARRSGTRVLQADGVPQEAALPFWTLHQLTFAFLQDPFVRDQAGTDFIEALSTAMGSRSVGVEAKLSVSRSALRCLGEASARTPLLLVVDDAEWMDELTRDVLCFFVNRLVGGDVALVLVYNRAVPAQLRTSRLIEVTVKPMTDEDAQRTLLHDHPRLPPYVVDRIIHEADGNRLAVREYPNLLPQRQLDGREILPPVLPLPSALLDCYREALASVPPAVRQELVLGAVSGVTFGGMDAGPVGWSLDAADLASLESLGLVAPQDGNGVHFANRTVRNAIYCLTPPRELREAHVLLADRYRDDALRRVLHTAAAATQPNEDLAADLSAAAHVISAHREPGMALHTLVRAAAISPAPAARSARLTEAARVASSFGQAAVARKLIEEAAEVSATGANPVGNALLRAGIKVRHDGDYPGAARIVAEVMPRARWGPHANETMQLAVGLSVLLDDPSLLSEVARHARSHDPELDMTTKLSALSSSPDADTQLVRPIADVIRDVYRARVTDWTTPEIVQFGLSARRGDVLSDYRSLLWETFERTNRSGALVHSLDMQLLVAAEAFQSGLWDKAEELALQGYRAAANSDIGTIATDFRHIRALVAAARGDVRAADALADAIDAWGTPRRSGHYRTLAVEARLLNRLSQGDSEGAWSCATRILVTGDRLPAWPLYGSRLILDVVEAHVRSGHGDDAAEIAAHAANATGANHPLRLRFLVAAATALTANGDEAQERFVDALELDGIDRWPFEQARVEYLFGQWLRRHFANVEARRHLTRARDLFEVLGADPWSRRVGHELRAAGLRGNGSNLPAEPLASELTPQESEVAALAAAGLSNKDIAARLFISPRTVSGHLYRIFPKLNVVSRAGLRDALATRNALESAGGPLSQPNKVI